MWVLAPSLLRRVQQLQLLAGMALATDAACQRRQIMRGSAAMRLLQYHATELLLLAQHQ